MRVVISGGTGLVGSLLTRDLAKDGHQVYVLTRNPEKAKGSLPPGVQAAGWDARTAKGWGHLVDGADAIINLAGENISGEGMFPSRWTAKRKQRILQSRLDVGNAILEAVRLAEKKPGGLIQISAIGYYPPNTSRAQTEADPPGSGFQPTVLRGFEDSTAPVEELGVRRVVVRSGVVLSNKGGALVPQVLPFKMFVGGPLGSGKQYYSWCHIADVVAGIRYLIETPTARGVYNLTSPQPVTNSEFGHTIARVLKRPYWIPVPAFALRLVFGEVSEILLDGWWVLPQRLAEQGFKFRFPDPESALRDLLGK